MRRSQPVTWTLLRAAFAAAAIALPTAGSSEPPTVRTFRFTYSVAVRNIPKSARRIAIWVPVPMTDGHQKVLDLVVRAPLEHRLARESAHQNRMLYLSGAAPLPPTIEFQVEAAVARRAYRVLPGNPDRSRVDPPTPRDLGRDRLVPIDGPIAHAAHEATLGAHTALEKARAIYDYVTSTMRYDKRGKGWGRGDALYACDVRAGNCTDFHSLIIGMARASGIPSRFVIGFPLPDDRTEGEIPGYHCWAELFVEGIGWLPMDSSEASRHPERRDVLFGGLDANRVAFTRGRDLVLEPPSSEPLNFFVYPRVEVDGTEHRAVNERFTFAEIKT